MRPIIRLCIWASIAWSLVFTSIAAAGNSGQSLNVKLIQDAYDGSLQNVEQDLAHGANVNAMCKSFFGVPSSCGGFSGTPLYYAVDKNHMDIIRILLMHGADPNEKVAVNTPLFRAVLNGNVDVSRLLLVHGADVNMKDPTGLTALTYAVLKDNVNIVRVLLNHGADVNATTGTLQQTALIRGALNGHSDVVRLLLSRGADVGTKDTLDMNALMWAAQYGYVKTVQLLLAHGADVNAKDQDGETALMLADQQHHADIVSLLRAAAQAEWLKLTCERNSDQKSVGVDINAETKSVRLFNGTVNWDHPNQVTVKAFTDDQIEFTTPDTVYNCDASGHCAPAPAGAYSDVRINRDTGQMEIDAYAGNQLTRSQWTCTKAEQKF